MYGIRLLKDAVRTGKAKAYGSAKEYWDAVDEAIAEIESELDDAYVKLPKDADDKPIHPGDTLVLRDNGCGMDNTNIALMNDGSWRIAGLDPSMFRHVKPRTLEDVLKDVVDSARFASNPSHVILGKFAAEIRKILGVANEQGA